MKIEILYFDGCPHAQPAFDLVEEVAAALAPAAEIQRVRVEDEATAEAERFLGSPSIRVDGHDVEGRDDAEPCLACRMYEDGAGVPPRWLMEAAVLRALAPSKYLFLCVANSARSQLAEAIAKKMLGATVLVQSAGSQPSSVRPEATEVLGEIGIDISPQRSKSVEVIHPGDVDVVITLCAEEVCPAFLGAARRVHWGLSDPAAVTGSARLDAFRTCRDELQRRIAHLAPMLGAQEGATS